MEGSAGGKEEGPDGMGGARRERGMALEVGAGLL